MFFHGSSAPFLVILLFSLLDSFFQNQKSYAHSNSYGSPSPAANPGYSYSPSLPGYSYSPSSGYQSYLPPQLSQQALYFLPVRAPNPAATEWPYAGGINSRPTPTLAPTACRSTTFRTILGCPCKLLNQRCFQPNVICTAVSSAAVGVSALCSCISGYLPLNGTCVTTAFYNQTVAPTFALLAPTITAYCFLPANAVVGNVPQVGASGSPTYTLTLLSSLPVNVSTAYISIESPSGNLLFTGQTPRVDTVLNQTYSVVGKDSSNITSNTLIFTIAYYCTAPVCSFDFGNTFTVDCTRIGVADTIVTALATGTLPPTTFSMTLVSSTSTLGNTLYAIDPTTGQIFLQAQPHGGIFIEVYNVTATSAAAQSCSPITLTLTTTATCT